MKLSELIFKPFLLTLLLTSCRVGGDVTSDGLPYSTAMETPVVTMPTVLAPLSTPYYSASSHFTVSGMCMAGDSIGLTGDSVQTVKCAEDSTYSFNVSHAADGVYSFQITQFDVKGNASNPRPIVWIKKSTVTPPTIDTPVVKPYLSATGSVTLAGACETGTTISLGGDGSGTVPCLNSGYSINLPKASDGDYLIQVMSTDLAGNQAFATLSWKKHALVVTPSAPSLIVNTSQVFAFTGGSGIYSVNISTNNSGASYNPANLTYTVGTLAAVTDTLTVSDSYGASLSVPITSVRGAPDHLMITGGDAQTGRVGTVLTTSLQVRLVDRYGNGVPSYPILFSRMTGDAQLVGAPAQLTDSSGYVSIQLKNGYQFNQSSVRAEPLGSVLPDLALTGNTSVTAYTQATTLGTSSLGLSYPTGNNPMSLIAGKFKNSGPGDVVIVNANDNNIGVYLGKGNGLFGKKTVYSIGGCSAAGQGVSGDFNGDGNLDLAILCNGTSQIAILKGNGDGTFQNVYFLSTGSSPTGIVAKDLNGDGKTDLAVTSSTSNKVYVHFGNGLGGFPTTSAFNVGSNPVSIVAADLNKDGKPDLIVANSGTSQVGVLLNQGGGVFGGYLEYAAANGLNSVYAVDIDNDTKLDIITTNSVDNSVTILYGDGLGNLNVSSTLSVGQNPSSVQVLDLNQDGKLDLVVTATDDNKIAILYGQGARGFASPQLIATGGSPISLTALDVTGDGKKELFYIDLADSMFQELTINPRGALGFTVPTAANPSSAVTGDFDGDGILDLAIANSAANNIQIFKGIGDGNFSLITTLSTGSTPVALVTGDFDGDGKLDLGVVEKGINSFGVFLGNGNGTFGSRADFGVANGPVAVTVGDFNHDGKLDVAVSAQTVSKISVLINDGTGSFNPRADYTCAGGPVGIISQDLDHDGNLDLATVNASDGSVSVLLGNSNGSFRASSEYPVGTVPSAIVAGDFNGDGIIDLAATNGGDGTVSILNGIGNGAFSAQSVYSVGAGPASLVAGNFSNKGHTDLIVALGAQNQFAFLQGLNGGGFDNPLIYNETGSVSFVTAADLNQDGTLDVILLDAANGQAKVWLGQ